MHKKAKVIDINSELTSYGDIAEAVREETEEPAITNETEDVPETPPEEPKPQPKPRAKRTPKAKPLERTDSNMVVVPEEPPEEQEPETTPEPEPAPKPKAKNGLLKLK